jgi:preprotein translocase subunit YajC
VGPFLILVLILGAVWLLLVVPARRRQRSHAAMQDSIGLGDDIITAGGLHAIVREVDDDQLRVEIAPNVVVTLDRRAVAAVAREVEVEVEQDEFEEPDELEPPGQPAEAVEEPGSGTPPKPG